MPAKTSSIRTVVFRARSASLTVLDSAGSDGGVVDHERRLLRVILGAGELDRHVLPCIAGEIERRAHADWRTDDDRDDSPRGERSKRSSPRFARMFTGRSCFESGCAARLSGLRALAP